MTERIVPAAGAALVGVVVAVAVQALVYWWSPTIRIDFAVDPPRLLSGVHQGERDDRTGMTYAWSGRDIALRLPGLDRRADWTVELHLRGARENAADNPTLVFFVDGVRAFAHTSKTEFETVTVTMPARRDRPRGAMVTAQLSSTFVPGASDPRPLGVMLDSITVRPEGAVAPSRDVLVQAALCGAALGATFVLLGLTPVIATAVFLPLFAIAAGLMARGFAPFTDLPERAFVLVMAIALITIAGVVAIEHIRKRPLTTAARLTAALTVGVVFVKLLALLHPDMPLGDALFQAHRFQEVLRGNYYFTSIAPGNYTFPYAPGLYVAASPFADLVRREAGDVVLLRLVVIGTDAAAAALLYWSVSTAWQDGRAAAVAATLYQMLPLDFLVTSVGNLTNAFGQSVAVICLAVMAAPWVRPAAVPIAVITAALSAAFLSHTSTFAILAVTTFAVAVLFAWRGGPSLRAPGLAVGAAGVAAILVVVAIYYGHFLDTYRTEFSRIGQETAAGSADAGGRGIGARARAVPRYAHIFIGAPALILAALGIVALWRRGSRDRLTLATAGWGLGCGAFLLLGVLTPVDMRYYLAALPAVAIAAAAGVSDGWARGGVARAISVALLIWSVWLGVSTWWRTLA